MGINEISGQYGLDKTGVPGGIGVLLDPAGRSHRRPITHHAARRPGRGAAAAANRAVARPASNLSSHRARTSVSGAGAGRTRSRYQQVSRRTAGEPVPDVADLATIAVKRCYEGLQSGTAAVSVQDAVAILRLAREIGQDDAVAAAAEARARAETFHKGLASTLWTAKRHIDPPGGAHSRTTSAGNASRLPRGIPRLPGAAKTRRTGHQTAFRLVMLGAPDRTAFEPGYPETAVAPVPLPGASHGGQWVSGT